MQECNISSFFTLIFVVFNHQTPHIQINKKHCFKDMRWNKRLIKERVIKWMDRKIHSGSAPTRITQLFSLFIWINGKVHHSTDQSTNQDMAILNNMQILREIFKGMKDCWILTSHCFPMRVRHLGTDASYLESQWSTMISWRAGMVLHVPLKNISCTKNSWSKRYYRFREVRIMEHCIVLKRNVKGKKTLFWSAAGLMENRGMPSVSAVSALTHFLHCDAWLLWIQTVYKLTGHPPHIPLFCRSMQRALSRVWEGLKSLLGQPFICAGRRLQNILEPFFWTFHKRFCFVFFISWGLF